MIKRGKISNFGSSRFTERFRQNSRGQFYILAALIIISVLIGIFVYGNYAKTKKEYSKIYDLGDELEIETGHVYDYGTYNRENTANLTEKWAETYYNYTREIVEDWVFIYGNEEKVTALYFTKEESGNVCVQISVGSCIVIKDRTTKGKKGTASGGKNATLVDFKGYDYFFELKEGENFFFVIKGGEYTAT